MDGRWRNFTAGVSGVVAGDSVIDVCCGTGDLSLSLLDRVSSRGRVVGLDFADEMLDVARTKSSIVEWIQGIITLFAPRNDLSDFEERRRIRTFLVPAVFAR